MAEIILRNSILDIHPKADIQSRGIQLLTVDVENVLTDFGNPTVLPGIAQHISDIHAANSNLRLVLITNKASEGFLDEVKDQLPNHPAYINPNPELGLRSKPYPDMFRYALRDMFPEVEPQRTAHADDQLKAYYGLQNADYGSFFWTRPIGEHQHFGVKILRTFEFGLVRPIISARTAVGEIMGGDF